VDVKMTEVLVTVPTVAFVSGLGKGYQYEICSN
jgi:hypothetical protein